MRHWGRCARPAFGSLSPSRRLLAPELGFVFERLLTVANRLSTLLRLQQSTVQCAVVLSGNSIGDSVYVKWLFPRCYLAKGKSRQGFTAPPKHAQQTTIHANVHGITGEAAQRIPQGQQLSKWQSTVSNTHTHTHNMSLINVLKCASIQESKDELQKVIQNAVDEHTGAVFTVGLSGGSLPTILAEILPKISTDWKKWKFFFCDERLVSFSDPESTFGAYRSILVPKIADLSLNQFVTIDPSLKAWNSAYDYLSKMKQVFSRKIEVALPRFDLLFLGMGPDGHTCSLFPNHPLLGVSHLSLVS